MWLISQHKDVVIKTKGVWANLVGIYTVEGLQMGEYESPERAQEIIQDIIGSIYNGDNRTYTMPKS